MSCFGSRGFGRHAKRSSWPVVAGSAAELAEAATAGAAGTGCGGEGGGGAAGGAGGPPLTSRRKPRPLGSALAVVSGVLGVSGFFSGGSTTGADNTASMNSSISQMWSVTPAAIAGVMRSDLGTQHRL